MFSLLRMFTLRCRHVDCTLPAQYLDENQQLILAIMDNQNLGKLNECAQYQARLQQNLMYLAAIADAQPQPQTHPQQARGLRYDALPARFFCPRAKHMKMFIRAIISSSQFICTSRKPSTPAPNFGVRACVHLPLNFVTCVFPTEWKFASLLKSLLPSPFVNDSISHTS
eukprot:jgi/Mesvir1/5114/Mv24080-RA.1